MGCGAGCGHALAFAAVMRAQVRRGDMQITVLYGVRTVGVGAFMMPMTAHACAALSLEDIAQGTAIITSFRQIFGARCRRRRLSRLWRSHLPTSWASTSAVSLCFEVQRSSWASSWLRRGHGVCRALQRKRAEAARLSVVRAMLVA